MCHCKYFDYFDFDCGDCGGCTFVSQSLEMWRSGVTSVRELWAMQTRPCTPFSSSSCTCFFFFKCWKRDKKSKIRTPAEQWASPELLSCLCSTMLLIFQFVPNSRCRPGCHQGLQVGDEDMQAAGRFHQQNVMVSQLQTQRSDGERFSYRQRVYRKVIQLYSLYTYLQYFQQKKSTHTDIDNHQILLLNFASNNSSVWSEARDAAQVHLFQVPIWSRSVYPKDPKGCRFFSLAGLRLSDLWLSRFFWTCYNTGKIKWMTQHDPTCWLNDQPFMAPKWHASFDRPLRRHLVLQLQWAGGILKCLLNYGSHGVPTLGEVGDTPQLHIRVQACCVVCTWPNEAMNFPWRFRSTNDHAACTHLVFPCRYVSEQPQTQCC